MFSDRFQVPDKLIHSLWDRSKDSDTDRVRTYNVVRDTLVEVLIDIRNARIFDRAVALNFVCGDQSFEERLVSAEHINYPDVLEEYQKGCELDWDCVSQLRRSWLGDEGKSEA